MKTISELAKELYDAKRAEDAAKKLRIAAEEAIAALVETDANGSKTVEAGEGLKVTVKRELSYKADLNGIRGLNLDEEFIPVIPVAPQPAGYAFDEKAYEILRITHPDKFSIVSQFVEVKPRKTAVTLKLA